MVDENSSISDWESDSIIEHHLEGFAFTAKP